MKNIEPFEIDGVKFDEDHLHFFLYRDMIIDLDEVSGLIDHHSIFEELNIDGFWDELKRGCSTIIYTEDHNNSKVLGLSLDLPKIDYMSQADLPGFKVKGVVDVGQDEAIYVIVYEMKRLFPLFKHKHADLYFECEDLIEVHRDPDQRITKEDIEYAGVLNEDQANLINGVLDKYYGLAVLDLSSEQFMIDEHEDIFCVDPIISMNIDF